MIDALVSGKLVKEPELKTGPSGKHFCNFLLSVSVNNEPQPIVVSAIAFEAVAERIAKLGKGDGCVAKFFKIRDNARFLAIEKPND